MSEMNNVSESAKSYFASHPDWNERYKALINEAFEDEEVQQFLKENKDNLTKEEVKNSYSKLFEFVKEKRKVAEGAENQLAKGFRPRLVLNHHYIDVQYVPTEEYRRYEEEQRIKNCVELMDMPVSIRSADLDGLLALPERKNVMLELSDFLTDFAKERQKFHQGLYIYGNFGIGKSYLLGAIANEFARRKVRTIMVHLPSFIEEVKGSFHSKDKTDNTSEKIERIKEVEILMIDDIGAEDLTEWSRDSLLAVILQYRMQEEKITFFSSNLNFEDLREHLTITKNNTENPMKARRIMERVKFLSREVRMDGNNLRVKED
ncbi:primosomal protein DnaI [Pilibacter termitis]|uniref:Primosomal protein DnaI n=1 Tax=Pilibacter termitis TaxID=263852 RepID=A0A1T4NLC9_9ENTE|nr:primosomal protein DnaI [Pilibacter termitis]SJZ79847.1 primosomal protein DnaI [Pilibacter termitis]